MRRSKGASKNINCEMLDAALVPPERTFSAIVRQIRKGPKSGSADEIGNNWKRWSYAALLREFSATLDYKSFVVWSGELVQHPSS